MCKYNFNPKPNNVHECWEECECNSCTEKRGEVERLSGCTSVKGSTMAVHHSIQPDKTPPASKKEQVWICMCEKCGKLNNLNEQGITGFIKSEGHKEVLDLYEWHEPYNGEVFCPFCGVSSGKVKTNGNGFYRCKGECKNRFYLMRCTEDDKGGSDE